MKLDEILTLGKMGYTKEEIQAFETSSEEPMETETNEGPKEYTNTGTTATENNVDTILLAIKELTKTIQASNIQNASSATVNNSADDVIKYIIRGGEK